MTTAQEVLDFWFGGPDHPQYGSKRQIWFEKNDAFDEEIRARFGAAIEAARSGELDDWKHEPESCLALILLLDQFPRNVHRDNPMAYASDAKALEIAKFAIRSSHDRHFSPIERPFFYLPFEHSEDMADQERSVALFQSLGETPEAQETFRYAILHKEIIERFGRYPHRNKILGRETTTEEQTWLENGGATF
jgi:uncharacterized protein (DUF924 family)